MKKLRFLRFCNLGAGRLTERIVQFSQNLAGVCIFACRINDVVFEAIQVKHRSLNESQTGKKIFFYVYMFLWKQNPPEVGEK